MMTEGIGGTDHHLSDAYSNSKRATDSLLASIQTIVKHYEDPGTKDDNDDTPRILQESAKQILTLKQSQRGLGLKLGSDLSEELSKKKRQVENQALLLQNILYEKNHLLKEIRQTKRLACPNLLKMAKDELKIDSGPKDAATNQDDNGNDTDADTDANADADAIIDRFLAPPKASENYTHKDPARHSYNLSKMHSELTTRGTLHTKLLKAKKQKSALLEGLTKKRKFLSSLPQQILQLEKGLDSLKGHFENVEMNPSASLMNLGIGGVGGDLEREKQARELSAPLYTLFVQFGSFIQAHSRPVSVSDSNVDVRSRNKPIVDKASNGSDGDLDCTNWKLDVVASQSTHGESLEEISTEGTGAGANAGAGINKDASMPIEGASETKEMMQTLLQKEVKALQLQIPVSATGKDKQDRVTIQFEYLPQLNIITAHVVQSKILDSLWSGEHSQTLLLTNLFDGDNGNDLPVGSSSALVYRDDSTIDVKPVVESEEDDSGTIVSVSVKQMALWNIRQTFYNKSKSGKPYNWCQYLAGLNYPKPAPGSRVDQDTELLIQSQIEVSTKTVLLALYRRIRSHSILGTLVKKLGKSRPNPIPYHPSLAIDDTPPRNILTKLVSFEEIATSNSTDLTSNNKGKEYSVIILRKQISIKIRVRIDARYPSVPPSWSLQPSSIASKEVHSEKRTKTGELNSMVSSEASSDVSLYDSTLGMIESRVNALEDSYNYFNDGIEESYDWILVHQLRCIINEWDTYQKTEEEEGTPSTNMGRSRRGRDRQPAALYELYKHGL